VNISGNTEQEYFADGMTDALIANLGKIGALSVRSRQSVMRYKESDKPRPEIAQELNVDALVEGSILFVGNQVRIIAKLMDPVKDRQLWTQEYIRELGDILILQSELTQDISREIQIAITPDEKERISSARTVDPEAYKLYLKGKHAFYSLKPEGLKKAPEYFQKAIELDPQFALAYLYLGGTYYQASLLGLIPFKEAKEKAKIALFKARDIDNTLAEVHAFLGAYNLFYLREFAEAEKEIKLALKLNPSDTIALMISYNYLNWMGKHGEAIAAAKKLIELEPLEPRPVFGLAWVYFHARQYKEAISQFQKAIELGFSEIVARSWIALSYALMDMPQKAIAECKKSKAVRSIPPHSYGSFGAAYALAGKSSEAREILNELLEKPVIDSVVIAKIYVSLGEKDKSIEWLYKGYEEQSSANLGAIRVSPLFDSIRDDPRYIALLDKMGFE
jgi:TolB-like protein